MKGISQAGVWHGEVVRMGGLSSIASALQQASLCIFLTCCFLVRRVAEHTSEESQSVELGACLLGVYLFEQSLAPTRMDIEKVHRVASGTMFSTIVSIYVNGPLSQ